MKTLLLSFIPLIAVIVHATPTINVSTLICHYHDGRLTWYRWQDRMESFEASDSLDGRAHRRVCTLFTA